ncbi:polysaccharide deacetylase family protein [Dactylosporangium sp. AC04546]|uniref:polysaccharide deacetylase family protein n=1 Tax=Dactylosporangium sp. AC04546 TaxID=2862460 RepID=UPI001EDDB39B|nr:polysaccharide deacetylase family protein [Dactylosporangium sp. AC04546]WVK84116.1 polysaccharide deacetylase family protein [Dactylosporangium sp. AC04546]
MLIGVRTARRLAVGLTMVAVLAACDDSAKAGRSAAAGASASPAVSVAPSPSTEAPGQPVSSAQPSKSPGGGGASASPSLPPPGSAYQGRLPKFGKPPTPHRINVPEGNSAPWLSRIPTDQPVAFITIDDGWIKRPEALELFREAGVPVSLFLTINAIKDDPAYFQRLQDAGAVIEAHTISHQSLKGKPYSFQRKEICGSADQLGQMFGKRPTLFRPPFGEKDATTLKVIHECGMKAGLFWKETVDKGIVRYQEGKTVQPGDVILMHFRDRFVDDFIAALQAIAAAGLTPALLEDYIP